LPVTAAEPPPLLFQPPAVASPVADLALSVRARKALQEDPELGKLILGIVVENGCLRLWGPVPSEEIGRRVVKKLEGLRGVRSIQNDLRIVPPETELAPLPLVADPPAHSESASPGTAFGPNVPEAAFPAKEPARPSVALLPPVAVQAHLPTPTRS